jgi:hypothetical protein
MNCVELASRSRIVQKKGGIDRIRRMKYLDRLKASIEIADELGRKEAKRKCAMRLAEMLMLKGKYGKAKKISDKYLEDMDFLKVVSAANEKLIGQGQFLRSAELNRSYSFVYGMSKSAGLEMEKRMRNIDYNSLKRLAKKYGAERELVRCIREEIGRFRSRKLEGDANWLAAKFGIIA